MELYRRKENETLRCSNLSYGLIAWFYNNGHKKTCGFEEAKQLDQRAFGPAVAKGLIAHDGHIWFLTQSGEDWMKSFHTRTAWKELPSRDFSHWIKVARSKVTSISKRRRAS